MFPNNPHLQFFFLQLLGVLDLELNLLELPAAAFHRLLGLRGLLLQLVALLFEFSDLFRESVVGRPLQTLSDQLELVNFEFVLKNKLTLKLASSFANCALRGLSGFVSRASRSRNGEAVDREKKFGAREVENPVTRMNSSSGGGSCFCSTSLPLASKIWVRSIFSILSPLSSNQHHW